MTSLDEQLEANFAEAANNWNLEKLYIDLAGAKGRGLTSVEKKFLRGLLCGYSPAEIAAQVYKSANSSTVRVYLSNGLYKYIQELLLLQGETGLPIINWSRVTNLLEKAGYKLGSNPQPSLTEKVPEPLPSSAEVSLTVNQSVNQAVSKYHEWQQAIDIADFYGRQEELTQLKQWIVNDSCRLIAILGMGGVGKTALAIKVAQQTAQQFELLIWRSLSNAPPLEYLLEDLIQSLSQSQETNLPTTVEGKISQLITYLHGSANATTPNYRCLLVLDQIEVILHSGELAGSYRTGYQGYSQLFRQLAQENHQSCCLLISREKPKDIALLAGAKLPVRSFQLGGLKTTEGIILLQSRIQGGSENQQELLAKFYASNPLILKMVATTIQGIFDSDINEFLAEGTLVFGDIQELLDQQFSRISDIERQVMYGLAMHRGLVSLPEWSEELIPGLSKWERLEALESLLRRCLINKTTSTLMKKKCTYFMVQPVMRVYVAQKLRELMTQEMTNKEIASLIGRTLLGTCFKDLVISN